MIQNEEQSPYPLTSFLKDYSREILSKISVFHEPEVTLESSPSSSESESISEDLEPSNSETSEKDLEDPPKIIATISLGVKVEEVSEEEMTEAGEPSSSNTRTTSHVSTGKIIFTLDDIPTSRWQRDYKSSMHGWKPEN